MIERIYQDLGKLSKPGKVIVLYGPRRVGKTTLLNNYLKKTKYKYKLDSGDNLKTNEILRSQDFDKIFRYVEGYELIVIDEAQRIPDVGLGLKIIVDHHPKLRVIITGSSSLDLSYKIGEPLVGRKFDYNLYPVSQLELKKQWNLSELEQKLEDFLIFGSYPEVLEAKTVKEKVQILTEIVNSYLLKDILEIERVKKSKTMIDLLKLLAFQIGGEVSLNELGNSLEIDKKTVARYLDLLEQSFIIYNLRGFSRNLRKEINKKSKYYFYDNGIRNGLIQNFNELDTRNDVGQLWENFIFMERMKKRSYKQIYSNDYFWRTHDQQEIDLIEEQGGKLSGHEFKWSERKKVKAPKDWLKTYDNASYKVINRENYLEFIV